MFLTFGNFFSNPDLFAKKLLFRHLEPLAKMSQSIPDSRNTDGNRAITLGMSFASGALGIAIIGERSAVPWQLRQQAANVSTSNLCGAVLHLCFVQRSGQVWRLSGLKLQVTNASAIKAIRWVRTRPNVTQRKLLE